MLIYVILPILAYFLTGCTSSTNPLDDYLYISGLYNTNYKKPDANTIYTGVISNIVNSDVSIDMSTLIDAQSSSLTFNNNDLYCIVIKDINNIKVSASLSTNSDKNLPMFNILTTQTIDAVNKVLAAKFIVNATLPDVGSSVTFILYKSLS